MMHQKNAKQFVIHLALCDFQTLVLLASPVSYMNNNQPRKKIIQKKLPQNRVSTQNSWNKKSFELQMKGPRVGVKCWANIGIDFIRWKEFIDKKGLGSDTAFGIELLLFISFQIVNFSIFCNWHSKACLSLFLAYYLQSLLFLKTYSIFTSSFSF